jgi:hypothetical protein
MMGGDRCKAGEFVMVSAVTTTNKALVDNAATTLLSPKTDANANQGTEGGAAPAAGARGPAVLVSLSAQADLVTRQKALDALNALPDNLASALSDQLQKDSDALNTLDQARKSTASDRKAEAEKKLEQATKKLQLLQILGGDPKALASRAKEIGKEIKDAAKEYTAALKDEAGGSAAAAAATTATTAQGPATTASDGAGAATPDAAIAAASDPAQSSATVTDPASAPQRATVQPPQSAADKAAADAENYRLGQHERDVVANFKAAAKTVNEIMDKARQQQKAKNSTDPGASGTAQVRGEMDKAVQDLSDTVEIKQDGGDISDPAGSAPIIAPGSGVDILA